MDSEPGRPVGFQPTGRVLVGATCGEDAEYRAQVFTRDEASETRPADASFPFVHGLSLGLGIRPKAPWQ